MKTMKTIKTYTNNKKAKFDYNIIETYEAGIVLTGAEVKSVRKGSINLLGSFVNIDLETNTIQLKQCSISKPDHLGYQARSFDELRVKYLLLNKKEINSILKEVLKPGYSIIPLSVYQREGTSTIKVKIGLSKGKKNHDKRSALKEKDLKIDMDRTIKNKEY